MPKKKTEEEIVETANGEASEETQTATEATAVEAQAATEEAPAAETEADAAETAGEATEKAAATAFLLANRSPSRWLAASPPPR